MGETCCSGHGRAWQPWACSMQALCTRERFHGRQSRSIAAAVGVQADSDSDTVRLQVGAFPAETELKHQGTALLGAPRRLRAQGSPQTTLLTGPTCLSCCCSHQDQQDERQPTHRGQGRQLQNSSREKTKVTWCQAQIPQDFETCGIASWHLQLPCACSAMAAVAALLFRMLQALVYNDSLRQGQTGPWIGTIIRPGSHQRQASTEQPAEPWRSAGASSFSTKRLASKGRKECMHRAGGPATTGHPHPEKELMLAAALCSSTCRAGSQWTQRLVPATSQGLGVDAGGCMQQLLQGQGPRCVQQDPWMWLCLRGRRSLVFCFCILHLDGSQETRHMQGEVPQCK